MDNEEYEEERVMLSDEKTYGKLGSDPTDRLKQEERLIKPQYKYVHPTTQNECLQCLCCTPKSIRQEIPSGK